MGVVFKIDPEGHFIALYNFTGGADGLAPQAGVILDSNGNLYGTTFAGGAKNKGVVFKVSPSGEETVLYSFTGGKDGGYPEVGVVRDPKGSLFGVTSRGGVVPRAKACEHGCGVLFRITP